MRVSAVPAPELATLHDELEQLGLSPSEARILVALQRAGSATAPQLAKLANVPRTNAYPVIESLAARQLATRVPGKGPTLWAAPPRDEVIPQLEAILVTAQTERLRQHRLRAARAEETMAKLLAGAPSVTHSHLQILRGPAQAKRVYDQLVIEAQNELLVCSRPPYTHDPRFPNPVVLDAMARGLRARALYERAHYLDPAAAAFRRAESDYHKAGVEWRLADRLPVKMAVADAKLAMVSFPDSLQPEGGELETTVLIEDPGYAELHASLFNQLWATASAEDSADERGSGEVSAGA